MGPPRNPRPPPQELDETATMLADFIDCPPDDDKAPETAP